MYIWHFHYLKKRYLLSHSFQAFEPLKWNFWCSCHKLKEVGFLCHIQFFHDLPEPLNELRVFVTPRVIRIRSQVFNINFRKTTDHQLQFLRIEYLHQSQGNNIMESLQKGLNLRFNILGHPKVTKLSYVLLFGLVIHNDLSSIFNYIGNLFLS